MKLFGSSKKKADQERNAPAPILSEAYISSVCELKSMANDVLATGVVTEIKEDSLRMENRGLPFPFMALHTRIKVNIFNSREGFRVLTGKVYAASPDYVTLVEASNLLDYERRNFFRIELSCPARIVARPDENSDWQDICGVMIRDLSLGGLLIEYEGDVPTDEDGESPSVDSLLFIHLKLGQFRQVVPCRVCRVCARENEPVRMGCEFVDLSTPQSDAICQYIFQRQREQIHFSRIHAAASEE